MKQEDKEGCFFDGLLPCTRKETKGESDFAYLLYFRHDLGNLVIQGKKIILEHSL